LILYNSNLRTKNEIHNRRKTLIKYVVYFIRKRKPHVDLSVKSMINMEEHIGFDCFFRNKYYDKGSSASSFVVSLKLLFSNKLDVDSLSSFI